MGACFTWGTPLNKRLRRDESAQRFPDKTHFPMILAFLNGRFLPAAEAALPLDDLGFVWGAVVVDRLRTFRQKLFRLEDHLRRFRQSCERASILQPRTDSELSGIAHRLIEENAKQVGPDRELTVVIFATPGVPGGEPTLGMQAAPLDFARYAPAAAKRGRNSSQLPSPVRSTLPSSIAAGSAGGSQNNRRP